MYETIKYDAQDGVGVITLDRPRVKNAICMVMRRELAHLIGELRLDRSLRALVVTGAGGNFCSGGDLGSLNDSARLGEASAESRRQRLVDISGLVSNLLQFDRPVIAAVQGVAYGAGFGIALTADIVLAAHDARFCLSFGRLGLVPDFGVLYSLPRVVGVQKAKELVFSCREVRAAEAQRLGIVMETHAPDDVLARAMDIARSFTHASALALSLSKRALNASPTSDLSTMLMLEADGQGISMSSDYHLAALKRFLAKEKQLFAWPHDGSSKPASPGTV
ncbi:enoyl-CoA hydratase/isomerase family protein [Variovorax robiniae]|uniref:Enoyl-CoA hydratase/isomerase family protein n=1 Tax=Variovorax robiniae TaxID=1836199 RepID=A0ABU8XGD4_9BURK